jgi:L-rhamnose mutarotase
MRRIAQVIGIPRENWKEYEAYHAAVWPTVLDRLERSNMRNFSIFRHGDLLFSYLEYVGEDYEADTQAIADDPETQRWWALQNPLQRPLEGRAETDWWTTIPEVFHTD